MRNIMAIAFLAFKEGIRQRVVYGVAVAAIVVMAFSVLLCGFFLRDISKVLLDFCLATVTLGGLTVPFFVAIHMLSRDIEKRTIFTLLSRPISRGDYIVGKFAGLSSLSACIMLLLGGFSWLAVQGGTFLFGGRFFSTISWFDISLALFLSLLSVLLLNATVVFWSTVTTSSFLTTLLTISTYVVGNLIDDVVRFLKSNISGMEISQSIYRAVDVVKYLFPNLSAFDVKQQAAHGLAIDISDVSVLCGYACAYTLFLLTASTLIFSRREFP